MFGVCLLKELPQQDARAWFTNALVARRQLAPLGRLLAFEEQSPSRRGARKLRVRLRQEIQPDRARRYVPRKRNDRFRQETGWSLAKLLNLG